VRANTQDRFVGGDTALLSAAARAYTSAQEVPMALIKVKDLQQSAALDRKAMQAIVGGARTGVRPVDLAGATTRSGRIVDYPPGFGRDRPTDKGTRAG
jgi:hypothetical protein